MCKCWRIRWFQWYYEKTLLRLLMKWITWKSLSCFFQETSRSIEESLSKRARRVWNGWLNCEKLHNSKRKKTFLLIKTQSITWKNSRCYFTQETSRSNNHQGEEQEDFDLHVVLRSRKKMKLLVSLISLWLSHLILWHAMWYLFISFMLLIPRGEKNSTKSHISRSFGMCHNKPLVCLGCNTQINTQLINGD